MGDICHKDIQTFKNCWQLLDPEKEEHLYPSILVLKSLVEDEAFNTAYKEFIRWTRFKIDPLGLTGAPRHHVIKEHVRNWENILSDIIDNEGHGRVFIASNKKETWRARLLHKQQGKVTAILGDNPNLHRVIVPVDFSSSILLVLKYLSQSLMGKNSFNISFVHVVTGQPGSGERPEQQWEKFKQIAEIDEDIPLKVVESKSDVLSTLVDIIRTENYGTIIMGKHSTAQIKRWLSGSVSYGVLSHLTDQTLFLID
jgi:2,4-dienoyl-CoA reductase (NADPH2)